MPGCLICFSNTFSALMFWIYSTSRFRNPPLFPLFKKKKKAQSFSQTFLLYRIILLMAPLSRWNSFDLKTLGMHALTISFQKAVQRRETNMCYYPAIFTWLWEYKLIVNGTVSQHLGQHLAHGKPSLDVCWMTKWINDSLPASKLGPIKWHNFLAFLSTFISPP